MTAPVITLDEASHEYRVDGQPMLGVTKILQLAGLGPDYSAVPPATLEWARQRGRHVDECCTLLDEGVLDWDSVADEARPYVEAWARFKDETAFFPMAQQVRVYHPTLGYCGAADVFGGLSGRRVCVEKKATSEVHAGYGLQLAAYTMPGLVHDGGAVRTHITGTMGRAVVHLLKTGKYKLFTDDAEAGQKLFSPDDWDVFTAAIQIARWKSR